MNLIKQIMQFATSRHSGSRSITARDAVLGTTELLESIIAFLPAATIHNAEQVCHTWHEVIIKRSKKIQRAAVIIPLSPTLPYELHVQGWQAGCPRYSKEYEIKLHPALQQYVHCNCSVGILGERFISATELEAYGGAFFPSPRCPAVGLEVIATASDGSKPRIRCVVYQPLGILINDVNQVARTIEGQVDVLMQLSGHSVLHSSAYAWFAT